MKSHYHNCNLTEKNNRIPDRFKALFLPLLLSIVIAFPIKRAVAQSAPMLSYKSPQVYLPNTVITPLAPTSSGVATPAYSTTPVNINTGLSSPFGVATDAAGNLYVSDLATKIVKEFPAAGGPAVIIGSGEFSHPEGITVDANGNVYAAGDYNGMVTEILKNDGSAVNSGTGFNEFSGVAVDAAGNIFVADFGNNNPVKEILKSNGNTVGIGTGFSNYCIAVATDAAGNVYVADTHNAIKEILASNGNTIDLGSGFSNPQGVAVDAVGNVFVSDQGNGAIKEIPVGSSTPVTLVSGLTNPGQIAVDGAGDIYFVDTTTGMVQEIKPVGGYYISALPPGLSFNNSTGVISGTAAANIPPTNYTVTAYNSTGSASAVINITIGTPPAPTLSYQGPQTYTSGAAIFPLTPSSTGVSPPAYSGTKVTAGTGYNDDQAVATDADGNIYVTDHYNNAVKKIPAGGGSQVTVASNLTGGLYGAAVDASGNLYVSENTNNTVLKIPAGGVPVSIGSGFKGPGGLAVDAAGNVYVADILNNAIKKILASDGSTVTLASGLGNGYGVAVDAAGNVYVAATYSNAVMKLPAGGGAPISLGSGFNTPESVAVDATGNVYVSDFGSKTIKMIAVGGGTSTVATNFSYPKGIAVDGAGNIYLADAGTDVVYQVEPTGGYYLNSALPAGLSFNGGTGVISGMPTVVSAAKDYTVTAYNVAGSAKATINLGVVAPVTVTSITRQNAALTNTFYAPYTVVFSGPVTGLKPSNFSVTANGITGANVNYISGSGNTFTVVVFTGTGDGTVTLNTANDLGVQPGISTALPFAGDTYTIDKTPPQLTTLYIASNNPDYTKAVVGNVVTVHFGANEALTNIVATIDGHNVTPVLDGTVYAISYTMTAAEPVGIVHYSISATDLAGNAFGPLIDVNDNVVFSLTSAVSSINVQNPANAITNAKTLTWRVTFARDVAGVSTSDFSVSADGTAAGTISGITKISNTVYDVTVNNVSGDGNLTLNLSDETSISPSLTSALPFVGQAYTIDNTLPDDFIGNPSVNNTTTGPVSYIIYYGDVNLNAITLSAADITLNKTGTANGGVSVSSTGGVYTVTISNITGNGTLGFTLAAGTSSDKAGNLAPQQVSPNFNVVSADATLTNFTIGDGTTYTPTFDKAVTAYYASVPNATTSTIITPYVSDSHATVTISGNPATSGQPYTVSHLDVGDNGFAIKVTAADGNTSTTYVLYITRSPSQVATLNNLIVDNGVTLSPVFNKNQLNYTASVPNATTLVNITPTVTDATAIIKVGGVTIASGTAIPFNLNIGINTFTAVVTAQDGVTINTYNIVITRAKMPQSITFAAFTGKTYGDADFAPGAVSDNSTIPIAYVSDNAAVATVINGQIHIVAAGKVNITASQAGNNQFLAANDVKVALTVNKAVITVTADVQSKIFGQIDPLLTYSVTSGSLVGSDAFTGALSRTGGENAGVYPISQGTLALSANYSIAYKGADFTINKALITVTANARSKVYGTTDPTLTYSVNPALIAGNSFTGALTRATGEDVGTYAITQGTLTAGNNYSITYLRADFFITQATAHLALSNLSQTYDGTAKTATVTITPTGLIGVSVTYAGSATAPSAVGDYAVVASLANTNYTASNATGTLHVTSATPVITLNTIPAKTYGDADFDPGATSTNNATALNYSSSDPAVAIIISGKIHIVGAGVTNITASQAADVNHIAAKDVIQSLTVNQKVLTLMLNGSPAISKFYDGSTMSTLSSGNYTLNGVVSGDAVTVRGTATYDNASAGDGKTITVSGFVLAGAKKDNYKLSIASATTKGSISALPITVTANAQSKVYGTADPILTYSVSPVLVTGDSFTGVLARAVGENTGTYAITKGTLTAGNNYSIMYVEANLSIGKQIITVAANAQIKIYGQGDPVLTYKIISGALVGHDAFTGALTRNTGENAGTYAITQGTLTAGNNYTLTYTGANLTINTEAITVTANAENKIYGQADPALTYKITTGALAGSDAFSGLLSRDAGENAGAYAIRQGTLSLNNNYTLSYVGANLIISQATLTIIATNQTKVYGAANPELTVSYSGFKNGDGPSSFTTQPVISTTATMGSPVATYPITGSGAVIPGYNVVYVKGALTITKATLMVIADNASRSYGVPNPAFTLTYSGFVNGDGVANLTTQAQATTKATTTSAPGTYAITPGGGAATDYSFNYVKGVLTVIPLSIAAINDLSLSSGTLSPAFSTGTYAYNATVENAVRQVELTATFDPTATVTVNGTSTPNGDLSSPVDLNVGNNTITVTVTAQDGVTTKTYVVAVYRGEPVADISATNILTPNGDGKNDTWVVKDIALYPDNNVTVYDRGGRVVYTKHGYQNEWTGTVNGQPLQEGTYYYVVDLGSREIRGYISILKSR